MKKLIVAVAILVGIMALGFWWEFIKSKPVVNAGLLSICLNKGQLKMEISESAKYLSEVDTIVHLDTLEIFVKTTTTLNPFAEKSIDRLIELNKAFNYIKVANKVVLVRDLTECQTNKLSFR